MSSDQFGILQHAEEAGTTSTRVWIQKIKVREKNEHTPAFGEVMKIKAFKEIIHISNLKLTSGPTQTFSYAEQMMPKAKNMQRILYVLF